MTSNLKKFRMQTFRDAGDMDEDPEDNTSSAIKKRHRREIQRAERENRENTSALLELRDMEDELRTLNRLFDTQTVMVEKMVEIYTSDALKDLTMHGQGYLDEALKRLAEYKMQTTEMLERVAATRGDVRNIPSPSSFIRQDYPLTPRSMRSSSRWRSVKRKSTTCAGPACRPS